MKVVLFHSVLGVRPAVLRAADRLRAAGHDVVVPDLFDGRTFDALDDGMAFVKELGWSVAVERAVAAVPAGPVVLAGWSYGGALAMQLAGTRPDVRGALLWHAGGPWEDGPWPAVPVEVHHSVDDPWMDMGEPSVLLDQAAQAGAYGGLHVYPGDAHLFTDEDHEDFDPHSSALLWARVLLFLGSLG